MHAPHLSNMYMPQATEEALRVARSNEFLVDRDKPHRPSTIGSRVGLYAQKSACTILELPLGPGDFLRTSSDACTKPLNSFG